MTSAVVEIRPARPEEAELLTELVLRSKAHWGYNEEFIEACRDELRVVVDYLDGHSALVAEDQGRVVGYSRVSGPAPLGELSALFVDPTHIGRGVGAALFTRTTDEARTRGYRELTIDADPGAEGFYRRMGAVVIGRVPSGSIPGRLLPHLRLNLT